MFTLLSLSFLLWGGLLTLLSCHHLWEVHHRNGHIPTVGVLASVTSCTFRIKSSEHDAQLNKATSFTTQSSVTGGNRDTTRTTLCAMASTHFLLLNLLCATQFMAQKGRGDTVVTLQRQIWKPLVRRPAGHHHCTCTAARWKTLPYSILTFYWKTFFHALQIFTRVCTVAQH